MGGKHSKGNKSSKTVSRNEKSSKNGSRLSKSKVIKDENAHTKLVTNEKPGKSASRSDYFIANQIHTDIYELTLQNEYAKDKDTLAISPLKMDIMLESSNCLHFKIYDPVKKRFEVPLDAIRSRKNTLTYKKRAQETNYDVEYHEKPFGFTVTRRTTGFVLFNLVEKGLVYEDERIYISTSIHSRYIYGLGEHQKRFLIDTNSSHNFVFWARDQPPGEDVNLYGAHPFFLALEEDGNCFGVFLLNSCAMEIIIEPGRPSTLSYRTNGGVLDFYIFTGPSPVEVVQQYQEVIGKPCMPPYWALGFHLCRWGYETVEDLKKVISANRESNIPYESQWTDIDMLSEKQSWTFKDTELRKVVEDLHKHGQKYIPIVNPGVSIKHSEAAAYADGIKSGIFIRNYTGARPLVGKVWPGEVAFPDFSHPDIEAYWLKQAKSLYSELPFDGLWLDMNEPANFVPGCSEDCKLTSSHAKDYPSFVPSKLGGEFLFDKTVCPSAKQHLGLHYELHNLYGHMQLKVSEHVCRLLRKRRSMIISRSTFPGSGQYGGHWTGDNNSTFSDMRVSISAMLDFNLFGIPLVGADVGGFFKSCPEELMVRWMQLGSFYPFMRNHNGHPKELSCEAQDPASYSQKAQNIMSDAVCVRYSLLPLLYTLFFESHSKGSPVVRPLLMLYPKDKKAYDIDEQFMWGTSLLISPCLEQGKTTVNAYFPFDVWYDFYTGHRLSKVGSHIQLSAPLDLINIHVRGGSIILTQTPGKNTAFSRRNPFGLLAALDSNHSAQGRLYWDNGDLLDPLISKQYNLIKFHVEKNILTSRIDVLGYTSCSMQLQLVQLFGLYVKPSEVKVNGEPVTFSYDDLQFVLQLDDISVSLLEPLVIEW